MIGIRSKLMLLLIKNLINPLIKDLLNHFIKCLIINVSHILEDKPVADQHTLLIPDHQRKDLQWDHHLRSKQMVK